LRWARLPLAPGAHGRGRGALSRVRSAAVGIDLLGEARGAMTLRLREQRVLASRRSPRPTVIAGELRPSRAHHAGTTCGKRPCGRGDARTGPTGAFYARRACEGAPVSRAERGRKRAPGFCPRTRSPGGRSTIQSVDLPPQASGLPRVTPRLVPPGPMGNAGCCGVVCQLDVLPADEGFLDLHECAFAYRSCAYRAYFGVYGFSWRVGRVWRGVLVVGRR
jgi:hypothetical protein